MSDIANSEGTSSALIEKPAMLSRLLGNDVQFPRFPDPTDEEFEEDIGDEERAYYKKKFADLDSVKTMRLHCSACDRHLGSSTRNESRMRAHPMLRTLVCTTCHTFYNSGEFEKGDDGSELYCRWCGQGGQVYCCSDCPHVFCAKCIKRNLGLQKIKEIENTDDWKCFKCNPKCLWELRAVCWALLRYCDLKNKITYKTEDPVLRETYQKDCGVDYSDCCKYKAKRRERSEPAKKKEDKKVPSVPTITKLPSSIQVKKFASINIDDTKEKKAQKRPAPQNENKMVFIQKPISIAPQIMNQIGMPPAKRPRMPTINPVRFAQQERKAVNTYARIRPKLPTMPIPIIPTQFNGFAINNNSFHNFNYTTTNNDTLNLSLENLTQGLDMVAVAAMSGGSQDDDVVCTPDFPLEPLCEVTEDNTDDDVQCITPGPVAAPKVQAPVLQSRLDTSLPDLSPDNIIQMTENDVTVNAVTGGLKFRVDPQTLSSNKMYRLPDGRIFAIKANPNMPGGYSATIVAVTETGQAKSTPKGATYAAKLSAVSSSQTSTPKSTGRSISSQGSNSKRSSPPKTSKVTRGTDMTARECDLQVPVEWYRYNLIDAVDALEYSLHRLLKLKKEATCRYLRTRTVDEMKTLHRTLDRLLNTSATRFNEIKDNLNKELKTFIMRKTGGTISDDDDDVEILPDLNNEDPIYIDENSVESNGNDVICHESSEVDLTTVGSDHNDSAEILSDSASKTDKDPDDGNSSNNGNKMVTDENSQDGEGTENQEEDNLDLTETSNKTGEKNVESENKEVDDAPIQQNDDEKEGKDENKSEVNEAPENDKTEPETTQTENKVNGNSEQGEKCDKKDNENLDGKDESEEDKKDIIKDDENLDGKDESEEDKKDVIKDDENLDGKDESEEDKKDVIKDDEKKLLSDDNTNQDSDVKLEDTEMSEEMIENLLYDDTTDTDDNMPKSKSMEVV